MIEEKLVYLRTPAETPDEMIQQAAKYLAACIPGSRLQIAGQLPSKLPEIQMVLTDCDGCLTDCGMFYGEQGDELKKFNARDGAAFQLLRERGIVTGIITGENMRLNERRAQKLNLDVLVQGCTDKLTALEKICSRYSVAPENVAYIGDDRADVPVLKRVGLGVAPSDATEQALAAANYIAVKKGGEGVLREVVELLLKYDHLSRRMKQ